jgi:hypothetical protein
LTNEDSQFTRYRKGYIDGYEGNSPGMTEDKDYMLGYEDGKEDDRLGEPSKYD